MSQTIPVSRKIQNLKELTTVLGSMNYKNTFKTKILNNFLPFLDESKKNEITTNFFGGTYNIPEKIQNLTTNCNSIKIVLEKIINNVNNIKTIFPEPQSPLSSLPSNRITLDQNYLNLNTNINEIDFKIYELYKTLHEYYKDKISVQQENRIILILNDLFGKFLFLILKEINDLEYEIIKKVQITILNKKITSINYYNASLQKFKEIVIENRKKNKFYSYLIFNDSKNKNESNFNTIRNTLISNSESPKLNVEYKIKFNYAKYGQFFPKFIRPELKKHENLVEIKQKRNNYSLQRIKINKNNLKKKRSFIILKDSEYIYT